MDSGRWRKVQEVFLDVAGVEPARRDEALGRACPNDPELRAQVERMLAADERAQHDRFLDGPAALSLRGLLWDDPLVGRAVGPYQILERIGEGGMGSVYRAAHDDEPTQAVALKLIRPGLESHAIRGRFRNERQVLAGLNHPRIAKVLDGGTADDGRPYLVMEFIEGEPIDAYCACHGLSVAARLGLVREVALAVEHAHQLGVIHRDLKPSNILVDREGKSKVLDFGVARVQGDGLKSTTIETGMGRPVGTLRYMSPEQVTASPTLDGRSDVYAIGVIAYELLAGRPPYDVANKPLAEAARIIAETEPAPLRDELRGPLEAVLGKALEKEPGRRYATAGALAADIGRYLNREPVLARNRGWLRVARRLRSRRVRPVLATGLLTAALAIPLGFGAARWTSPASGRYPAAWGRLMEARQRGARPGEVRELRLAAKVQLLEDVRAGAIDRSGLLKVAEQAAGVDEVGLERLARDEALSWGAEP